MRFHMYNQFLGTQLPSLDVKNMLGDDYQELVSYFGDAPAVFEAEPELNEIAYNKAMQGHFVCKTGDTYDVIVYTCDGISPYTRGNLFMHEGVKYLAINGNVSSDDYDLNNMEQLRDVMSREEYEFQTLCV